MKREKILRAAVALGLGLTAAGRAEAVPYRLTPADRAELTALMRTFFEATRDNAPAQAAVYPTPADVQAMFPADAAAPAGGAAGPMAELVGRHLSAVERDARDLRARFQNGVYVRASGPLFARGVIDLRPCGRFARPDSQCGDGPLLEYTVQGAPHRLRLDTLVRLRGHWRIFDARP